MRMKKERLKKDIKIKIRGTSKAKRKEVQR